MLVLAGNRGNNNVEKREFFGAVSDFCSAGTPGAEGSQEERQSLGETQILTNPARQSFAFGEGKRKGSVTPKSRKRQLEPYRTQSSILPSFVLLGARRRLNQPRKLNYFSFS